MTILTCAVACAAGLALGWFGYDFAKSAFIGVTEYRLYPFSRASIAGFQGFCAQNVTRAFSHRDSPKLPGNREIVVTFGLAKDGRE